MVHRAALNIPGSNFETIFFKDEKYVQVRWTPGGNDTIVRGPAKFADDSTALRDAGFTHIDAVLPDPGKKHSVYFFSGPQYAVVDFFTDTSKADVLDSVGMISTGWPSLKKAGFEHVDGAMMVPNSTKQAFVFCGNKYCRISLTGTGEYNDELLEGPINILTGWNAMGFTSVDTIFPQPGTSGDQAYVFSGGECVRTYVTPYGQGAQTSKPYKLSAAWSNSLARAGFY